MARTSKPKPAKVKPTSVQEEVTHLGVMVNLMKQMDREAQTRVLKYLNDRFDG
jgi:hypothetical protein